MLDACGLPAQPVPARLTPLFEARWSYAEFTQLMPFGPASEGQAYAYSAAGSVDGSALSGSLQLTQYPRARADGALLPDAHGLILTDGGEQVIIRAAGYGLAVPDAPGDRALTHWMRFWASAPDLAWLNATVAFGVGAFTGEEARVRYYAASPAAEASEPPAGAPALELLGTARWDYPLYEAVRPFGDNEGVGFAASEGYVIGGPLAGTWRGWHYPAYLRNGLYLLDAHAEIRGVLGVVLNRHGGLATRPPRPVDGLLYQVVQHATFVTEIPALQHLNHILAVGVGYAHEPGIVTLSYYGIRAPARD